MMLRSFILLVNLSLGTVIAKPSEPIANATEYRNVRYLPDWRYADDPSPERDGQIVMDIVVPDDGKDRHPVLFVVHGGGWSTGTKDEGVVVDTESGKRVWSRKTEGNEFISVDGGLYTAGGGGGERQCGFSRCSHLRFGLAISRSGGGDAASAEDSRFGIR